MKMSMFYFLSTLISLSFAAQNSRFSVWSPPNLIVEHPTHTDLAMSIGNFGYIPWGKTMIGHLYRAEPIFGCEPLNPISFLPEEIAPIVVLKRGECSFITKTYYAQLAGAKVVMVIDDREENVIFEQMIDDNSGKDHSLKIPTVLVPKALGEKIYAHVITFMNTGDNPVSVSIFFRWPQKISVESEIWISVSDPKSYEVINGLSPYVKEIQNVAKFVPHFILTTCKRCKANNYETDDPDCLSGGRYCAPDPDGDAPLSGKDAVLEALYQICLSLISPTLYFQYAEYFAKTCLAKGRVGKCNYLEAKIDKFSTQLSVNECIHRSFNDSTSSHQELKDNDLLREERHLSVQKGISTWPSVVINGNLYRGSLTPLAIFTNMCKRFAEPPEQCMQVLNSTYVIEKELAEFQPPISFWQFTSYVLLGVALFMLFFFLLYRRHLKRRLALELNEQIHRNVETYFRINDHKPAA